MANEEKNNAENGFQITENTTLKEAMAYISGNTKKGVRCPCCNGFVKLYKRAITSSNASALMQFFKISEKYGYRFYHITELMERSHQKYAGVFGSGEFARMRHYGFIVEQPKSDLDKKKKTSGFWALTTDGKDFCQGRKKVRKAVLLLNNKVLGFDGEYVDIKECFDEKFSYESVMSETNVSDSVTSTAG